MNKPTNILVTGADGQLGMELRDVSIQYPENSWHFHNRSSLSITDSISLESYISDHDIDCVINCAAYTAVDQAETDAAAFTINAEAAGLLAGICARRNVLLVHVSTDYVFNGNGTVPYTENDKADPINVYGASKLAGEVRIAEFCPSAIIIRTSWVYSRYGRNFVKTMMKLMKERESIRVVNDQYGSPTYAADLANTIMAIILSNRHPNPGIYHYCNAGITTWYDFALAIKRLINSSCLIHPIPTIEFPTPAKRPSYSVLDTSKIQQVFGIAISPWMESLKKCIDSMR